jgi:hypothetical protein
MGDKTTVGVSRHRILVYIGVLVLDSHGLMHLSLVFLANSWLDGATFTFKNGVRLLDSLL